MAGLSGEFKRIVDMLRFFARTRNYSFIDRIGNALNPDTVEFAVWDAVRTFISIYNSAQQTPEGYKFIVEKERERETVVRLPLVPDENEIKTFLSAVREDVGVARRVAVLALSFHSRGE